MRVLLDTHIAIWLLAGSDRIRPELYETLADPQHIIYVSAVSVWEMAIKVSLGKLDIPPDLDTWLPDALTEAGLSLLPIDFEHALGVEHLPRHHNDPFDRLLIAQAIAEELIVVSADRLFHNYDVQLLQP